MKSDPIIGFRIPKSLNKRLAEVARRFGVSKSDVVRMGLGATIPLIERGELELKPIEEAGAPVGAGAR